MGETVGMFQINCNSLLLRFLVISGSFLFPNHSITENCMFLRLCPFSLKCLETGVVLFLCLSLTLEIRSYILFLMPRELSPVYCLLQAQVILFGGGKFLHLCVMPMCLLVYVALGSIYTFLGDGILGVKTVPQA